MGATPLTSIGTIWGTADYMAPERIKGDAANARSDIYALGCMVYRCIVGELPYRRRTTEETLIAHLHAPIPVPSAKAPRLGTGFDTLVLRALDKDPGKRPASAGELMALSGETPTPLTTPAVERRTESAYTARRMLRRLVTGRTSHPFDEEMTYQYIVGETDDDDVARYILRTIANPEPGPGVFWRTLKFSCYYAAAKRALADGRVVLSTAYAGEQPWDEDLECVQTNDERESLDRSEIDVAIIFPKAILPGEQLAWQVEAKWPGFHRNIRDEQRDRNAITIAYPKRRLEFVIQLPPSVQSARFSRTPGPGEVVRADKNILHWRSHSPAPPGEYFWESQIDFSGGG